MLCCNIGIRNRLSYAECVMLRRPRRHDDSGKNQKETPMKDETLWSLLSTGAAIAAGVAARNGARKS